MAMGRRRAVRQEALFVTSEQLPRSQGHPFYRALNALLAEAKFDRWIEDRCLPYYEQVEKRGQRSIPPGCEGPGLADTGGRLVYAAWAGA
jgi:transposase